MFIVRKYQNKCLCITGFTFLIPFYRFLLISSPSILEKILGIYCLSLFVSTIFFWNNPVQNSLLHKIDAIIAKSCFVYYVTYTFSYKTLAGTYLLSYVVCISGMGTTFYYSNIASSKEWCSNEHIFYHGLLHFFALGLALHAYL